MVIGKKNISESQSNVCYKTERAEKVLTKAKGYGK